MIILSGDPTLGDMKTGNDVEPQGGVRMCDEHHAEICLLFDANAVPYAKTEEELAQKVKDKKVDALFETTRVLMTIAMKMMGSSALMQFQCPVCAVRKFDFLGETAKIIAEKVERTGKRILMRDDVQPRIQLVS